ncbi:MAG: hypothetical protein HYT37_01755 [Candidatus Sungbacteria bacterium]|nr:hypothetical protein [Candidatus Sungbacteria bacterium]
MDCRKKIVFRPPVCFVCGAIVPARAESGIPAGRTCIICRARTPIYAFFSPFSYRDPKIRTLIHDLKYKRMRVIAPLFAAVLQDYFSYYAVSLPDDAFLIPIPLHTKRRRLRGFNQAELIAKPLAEGLRCAFLPAMLVKTKKTKPQVGLLAEERRENMHGSFLTANAGKIAGKTVVLVDDVKTTGTTLEEAAYMLKRAGAARVWAVTVAH